MAISLVSASSAELRKCTCAPNNALQKYKSEVVTASAGSHCC